MPYQFVIIDDEPDAIAKLVDYLQVGFDDGSAVAYGESCAGWDVAEGVVLSLPDAAGYIAFFDLTLSSAKVADAKAGLERVRALRAQRRKWTFMAYSRFMETVAMASDADELFDGRVSKQHIDGVERLDRIDYVKRAVREAVAQRHQGAAAIPETAEIVDSFGMRVFRATFEDKTVAELLNAEAADWPSPRVEALTSGHSGAHLIKLSSDRESLVVKVARSASIIDHETQAVTKNLSRLGAFATKLAQFDKEMKPLSGGAVYYRQAALLGDSLLSHVTSCSMPEAVKRIEKVAKFSIETAQAYRGARAMGNARFEFTPVDRGRFETSLSFLIPFAKTMARRGLLDHSERALQALETRMLRLLEGWDSNPVVMEPTFLVLQHGDFNPGNVLFTSSREFTLIDLARFEDWPPGYDLARLALMLRLRLVDRSRHEDWLPFGLTDWLNEHVAAISPGAAPAGTCRTAIVCDQTFRKFVETSPAADREILRHGYRLGTMWDLIKVVSYQDVSQYKRLWALFELDRLAHELGVFKPKRT